MESPAPRDVTAIGGHHRQMREGAMYSAARRVRMPVGGMDDARCAPRVRAALERAGAREVHVIPERGEVWFGLPRGIDRAALRAAVAAAGCVPGEIERPRPT